MAKTQADLDAELAKADIDIAALQASDATIISDLKPVDLSGEVAHVQQLEQEITDLTAAQQAADGSTPAVPVPVTPTPTPTPTPDPIPAPSPTTGTAAGSTVITK